MKFENINVYNFENAIRGMRNPLNSWNKSDSENIDGVFVLGSTDLNLAQRLIKAGSEHRKFLRQIFVSIDITAPFYWWKELDTYKVATAANSCSTMHKITSEPITLKSFEIDDYTSDIILYENEPYNIDETVGDCVDYIIDFCEVLRLRYLKAKENGNEELAKKYWKELIRWLPEGWLQKRTWTCSYETLFSIVKQRSGHKLTEWHQFIEIIKTLPYAKELLFLDKE